MSDTPPPFTRTEWGPRNPHPLCARLRDFREGQGRTGWSLASVEARYGLPGVVLGGWETGRRMPRVATFDDVLQQLYGKRLAIVDAADRDAPMSVQGACVELRRIATAMEKWSAAAITATPNGS